MEGQVADDHLGVEVGAQSIGVPDAGAWETVGKGLNPRFVDLHERERSAEPVELRGDRSGPGSDLEDRSAGGPGEARDRGDGLA